MTAWGSAPVASRRRALVLGAAALAAGVAAIAVPAYRRLWPAPADRVVRRLSGLYPELADAAGAMRQAAWAPAGGGDRAALIRALFGMDAGEVVAQPSPALADALGRAVASDFAEARLAGIDGWTLAETELRLIALMTAPTA